MQKEAVIIAGANGSGKTTFAMSFLKTFDYKFLNTDEYAKQLNAADLRSVQLAAGKRFFEKFNWHLKNNENLLIESTLSGVSLKKIILDLKEKDYYITIVYIFIDNPRVCIERIKGRVKLGGHYVPDEDVIRRYFRSIRNFWNLYKNLADEWIIVTNSQKEFLQIGAGNKKEYQISLKSVFEKFMQKI